MNGEAESVDSPAGFLTSLGKQLSEKDGVDVDLAEILRTHLLKVSPTQDAVALAKAAIIKLAGERANPPKEENANG
jgi:hypothetical protein